MKLLTSAVLIVVLMNLSGCALLNVLKQGASNEARSPYPNLQSFKFEGALIYYKDLSSPCDESTVSWNDLNSTFPIQQASHNAAAIDCEEASKPTLRITAAKYEVEHQVSIPFESRKTELQENGNIKSFSGINEFVTENTQFQIYGAAGTIGKRSEALGLERASIVRDHMLSMGIQHERITIMPYDPQIPGLQAVVKVLRPVIL